MCVATAPARVGTRYMDALADEKCKDGPLRIQASRKEVAESLEGNWRPELLFVLKQEVEMYDIYQQRRGDFDEPAPSPRFHALRRGRSGDRADLFPHIGYLEALLLAEV